MQALYKSEMYDADRFAVEKLGFTGEMLMENAGQSIVRSMKDRLNRSDKIMVVCGTGKNGGDGIVIARQLRSENYDVQLWMVPSEENLDEDTKGHFDIYKNSGYEHFSFTAEKGLFTLSLFNANVIIDALLGIGLEGEVRDPYNKIITWMNSRGSVVYSIDVPSGVHADRADCPLAVNAAITFVIQCPKVSAFLYPSRKHYGEIINVDIGMPPTAIESACNNRYVWSESDVKASFPSRREDSHKGENGRVLIIGGSGNMPGAVGLTARACLRSGAGVITAAIPQSIKETVSSHILEAMYIPCEEKDGHFSGFIQIPENTDIIVAGMGMGRFEEAEFVILQALESKVPVILDADALYFLPRLWDEVLRREAPVIITPHEGEMARLCGVSAEVIKNDRIGYANELARRYGVTVVLKGPHTVTAFRDGDVFINTSGNSALAKGGSGDALAGVIAGYWGIHEEKTHAICNAVFMHGHSADMLVQEGRSPDGISPTDVIERLGRKLI